MTIQDKLTEILNKLASERPTPMGADVFWPEDPAPYPYKALRGALADVPTCDADGLCPHGESGGTCKTCYYESSNAFDAAMDDMHEDRGHD